MQFCEAVLCISFPHPALCRGWKKLEILSLDAKVNTSIFKKLPESHAKNVTSLTATLQQQHLLVHFLCLKYYPWFSFDLFLIFSQPLSLHLNIAPTTS